MNKAIRKQAILHSGASFFPKKVSSYTTEELRQSQVQNDFNLSFPFYLE